MGSLVKYAKRLKKKSQKRLQKYFLNFSRKYKEEGIFQNSFSEAINSLISEPEKDSKKLWNIPMNINVKILHILVGN